MAHAVTAPPSVCPDCRGFAAVRIDSGTRNDDGTRRTLTVRCGTCHGSGRALAVRSLAGGSK